MYRHPARNVSFLLIFPGVLAFCMISEERDQQRIQPPKSNLATLMTPALPRQPAHTPPPSNATGPGAQATPIQPLPRPMPVSQAQHPLLTQQPVLDIVYKGSGVGMIG
ncbi:hypothetical protein N7530_009176 [Penicillium desertorum]|uniref:Uncharacterized protein n=1 Tax=Penicillium desertorum TaxID=1303715 RepID=A0A9W9WHZ6_9EURO|nr:hypothetical protein N7530_009176 [Penicillium desertorum]